MLSASLIAAVLTMQARINLDASKAKIYVDNVKKLSKNKSYIRRPGDVKT